MDVLPPYGKRPEVGYERIVGSGESGVATALLPAASILCTSVLVLCTCWTLLRRAVGRSRALLVEIGVLSTFVAIAGLIALVVAAASPFAAGSPSPPGARELLCGISRNGFECYGDSIRQHNELVLLVHEPVVLKVGVGSTVLPDGTVEGFEYLGEYGRWLQRALCQIRIPAYEVHAYVAYPSGELWFAPSGTRPVVMMVEGPRCPWKGNVQIHVEEREDYFDWASAALHPSPADEMTPLRRGEKRYHAKCAACHSIDGTFVVGRSFRGMFGSKVKCTDGTEMTVDERYMREVILRGTACSTRPIMPIFGGQLSEKDLDALVTFIEDQKAPGSAESGR